MRIYAVFLAAIPLLAAACTPGGSLSTPSPTTSSSGGGAPTAATPASQPLLFGIGMHIEPLGSTAQVKSPPAAAGTRNKPDYNTRTDFERGVNDINAVAAIVESHNGKLTVQSQSPFSTSAVTFKSTVLSDLADRGHELGLHFHDGDRLG